MTREGLKQKIARALCLSMGIDPDDETMMTMADPNGGTRELGECAEWETMMEQATAALAAIEAAGVRLVVASCELEFARMADGTVKVGYNPRTEEGGWTLIGDVTKAVTAIEAQRDNALRDLDAANQLVIRARAALKETGQ